MPAFSIGKQFWIEFISGTWMLNPTISVHLSISTSVYIQMYGSWHDSQWYVQQHWTISLLHWVAEHVQTRFHWHTGVIISNNSSFHQEYWGILVGSDGSEWTSYPRTQNYLLPVAKVMGHVAYFFPILCIRNAVMYTLLYNNTCATLCTWALVTL